MSVIAYAYDADHHCKKCMLAYARAVPYKDYVWDGYSDADIQFSPNQPGIINVATAVELEIIRDSEGNAIHPVFSYQEWYNIGYGNQTLACTDCGEVLDEYTDDEDDV